MAASAVMLALGAVYVALAAEPAPAGPDATWAQYGVLGAVALAGGTFILRTHRRVVRDCDELSAEVRRLQVEHAAELTRVRDAHAAELRAINTSIQDRIVPLLTDTVRVMGEVTQVTRERR